MIFQRSRSSLLFSLGVLGVVVGLNRPEWVVAQTSLQRVATGIPAPLFVTAPDADPNRIFILEQGSSGTANIRVMDIASGTINTYLTLTGLSTGGERGLLGMAFHPNFANNGYFYINASVPGGGNHTSVVRRYQAQGNPLTSNVADPSSVTAVLSVAQPFSNHNGGWMAFNPKKSATDPQYLFISFGDGGSGGDPGNRAQDITDQWLGKMLRIDVDGDDFPADPARNYANPPTNPFVGRTGDDEIWGYGLRNAWRNSFDRRTGDLWTADVGQNVIEEINLEPADSPGGLNYGWRVMEGNNCFDNSQTGGNFPCNHPSFVRPIYEYSHVSGPLGGFSVTGGYVYRGSVAQFEGLYFFGDYVSNNIWTIDPYAVNVQASVLNRNAALSPNVGSVSGISSFGEDARGELYITSLSNSNVFRVSSTARTATWDGDQPVGSPGDGTNWGNANNWSRNGVPDTAPVTRDAVRFAAGSSQATIQLQADRTVGGVIFDGNYTLTGNQLTVLSGNIQVQSNAAASIQSSLAAETVNASLRKLGAGRLNLNGTAGQTVVLEGTLGGTGTVQFLTAYAGGTVSPGTSVGRLNVTNHFRMREGSKLEMEVEGIVPATGHDQLAVSGTATLDGLLSLITGGGYVDPTSPGTVDRLELITAAVLTGTFDEIRYNGDVLTPTFGVAPNGSFTTHVGNGLFRLVAYSGTNFAVENYAAIPGDANGDKIVDGRDFDIWFANRFTTGTDWLTADFNGDQVTDGQDLNIWNQFRNTTVVPEPVGLMAWVLLSVFAVVRGGGVRSGRGECLFRSTNWGGENDPLMGNCGP